MMFEVHRLAQSEFERAVIHLRSYGVSDRFVLAVDRAYQSIESHPQLGAPCYGTRRWVRTKKFKYIIYYEHFPSEDRIQVYAVAHGSRKPDYWLRRTRRP